MCVRWRLQAALLRCCAAVLLCCCAAVLARNSHSEENCVLSASQTNTHDSTLTCARFRQIDVPLSPIRDEQFVIHS